MNTTTTTAAAPAPATIATISIEPDDDDIFPLQPNPFNLSKSQAIRLIDRLHQAFIKANGLLDLDIDYRGLVEENIREQWTEDAINRGVKRGSRKYGIIPCLRSARGKNCRVFFRESEVVEWFEVNVKPILMKKSTHTTH